MLTPGDVEAVKEWVEAFGLTPIILPDIADSLDGHMIEDGFTTLTYGGTRREDIAAMAGKLALGGVLVALALMILSGADKALEAKLVEHSPAWLTNLTTRF